MIVSYLQKKMCLNLNLYFSEVQEPSARLSRFSPIDVKGNDQIRRSAVADREFVRKARFDPASSSQTLGRIRPPGLEAPSTSRFGRDADSHGLSSNRPARGTNPWTALAYAHRMALQARTKHSDPEITDRVSQRPERGTEAFAALAEDHKRAVLERIRLSEPKVEESPDRGLLRPERGTAEWNALAEARKRAVMEREHVPEPISTQTSDRASLRPVRGTEAWAALAEAHTKALLARAHQTEPAGIGASGRGSLRPERGTAEWNAMVEAQRREFQQRAPQAPENGSPARSPVVVKRDDSYRDFTHLQTKR